MPDHEIQELIWMIAYRLNAELFSSPQHEDIARRFMRAFQEILRQRRKHERMMRRRH